MDDSGAHYLGFRHKVTVSGMIDKFDLIAWLHESGYILFRDAVRIGDTVWPTVTYGFRDPDVAMAFKIRWG